MRRVVDARGAPGAGAMVAVAGWLVLAPSVMEYLDGRAVVNDGVVVDEVATGLVVVALSVVVRR